MRMNVQTMLVPHKHLRFSGSLIAVAGFVRKHISGTVSVDNLWAKVESASINWPSKLSFTQFVYALDILFTLGVITSTDKAEIMISKFPNDS